MKTPAFRITVNSLHVATIGLCGPGVVSCILDWTDRTDSPARKDAKVRMALGGLDQAAREFLDWPGRDLSVGDAVVVEIVDSGESTPAPERRPVETLKELASKKAYVRQAAKELGWTICENEK